MPTLTELRRDTSRAIKPAIALGREVKVTEHGNPLLRIQRDLPRVVLPEGELLALEISDEAIRDAVRRAQE